jgi:DeoD family purine-nucleoside phosphorylase
MVISAPQSNFQPVIHLQPTAPLAERVLLPGDPGRALLLAQSLLDAPKMFNHNRGLWGYTGTAADGELLTIQSTGMGGPSAAIVISELADLGAARMVRVGTCGALGPGPGLGDLVLAVQAIPADGTSQALGAYGRVAATPALVEAAHGVPSTTAVSTDLFYDDREEIEQQWAAAGAEVVEMEAATLYALAAKRGFQAAAILIVSDTLRPTRTRISPDSLRDAEQRLGRVALATLSGRAAA